MLSYWMNSLQRWRCWWRLSMMRGLFVGVGEREHTAFVPGTTKDRQARGQRAAASKSHRDGDCRKTGRRRIDLAVIAGQILSHVPDDRRRIAPRRINKRVELQRRHRRQHRIAKLL